MADITMCKGGDCRKKNECYRFLANANRNRQSYFTVIPYSTIKRKCDEFISAKG